MCVCVCLALFVWCVCVHAISSSLEYAHLVALAQVPRACCFTCVCARMCVHVCVWLCLCGVCVCTRDLKLSRICSSSGIGPSPEGLMLCMCVCICVCVHVCVCGFVCVACVCTRDHKLFRTCSPSGISPSPEGLLPEAPAAGAHEQQQHLLARRDGCFVPG